MEIEKTISEAIIEEYYRTLKESIDVDVVVAGAGPSGLYASYRLAKEGFKVVLLDRRLSLGGGIWGGGMMFNVITFREEAKRIFDELKIGYRKKGDVYVASAVELAGSLIYNASKSGAIILNGVFAEDIVLKNNRVKGVVINWSAVDSLGLMVDPLVILSRAVIDATGHPAEIVHHLSKRNRKVSIPGEGAMNVEVGDIATVTNTREIFPGLIVSGMAANAVSGSPRMGPTFGGMLLSGEKAYEIAKDIVKLSDVIHK